MGKNKQHINILTRRIFECVWFEGTTLTHKVVPLHRILNQIENEFEYIYAIADDMDKVLDLKKGETISFQFTRDNSSSIGILRRSE